jgi:hypothetical protein
MLFSGCDFHFLGEKLLTTGNPDIEEDMNLMKRLGLHPLHPDEARRVHRGEINPTQAKAADWPNAEQLINSTSDGRHLTDVVALIIINRGRYFYHR